jgi:hypothetical protein
VPRGKPGRAQKKVEARLRALEAVRGILAGHTYQQVADDLGYKNRGTVHRIVQHALARHEVEGVEELRALELERLDRIQIAFWGLATSGDVRAAEVVLRVIAARCRLLQLDRGVVSIHSDDSRHVVVAGGSKEEFTEALKCGSRATKSPSDP